MRIFKRRGRTVFGGLVLAAAVALVPAASASAVSFPTAHTNNATPNLSDIGADMTATSPASVAPGDSVSLSSIDQTLSIPPDIFVTGYCLFGGAGLITPGLNTFPANASTEVEATNTVEGTQRTDTASDVGEFTITDPTPLPGTPCGGDETSTPGELSYTYADQTWTAGGSPGTIEFRMDTRFNGTTLLPTPTANGLLIDALIGGVLAVQFRGAPGVVNGAGTAILYDDPAAAFATTQAGSPPPVSNKFSFGKVKLNKKKGTAKLPVKVPGPGKVVLVKTSKVKNDQKTAKKAGTVKLKVRAANKAKLKLKLRGKAKVKAKVKYTPDGGESATKSKQVQLKKKKKK